MINLDVITKDPDIGKKILIGSLLVLTGIGLFAVMGMMLEVMRKIDAGEAPEIPDIDNIGEFFIDGLRATAVGIIWSLPLALIITVFTIFVTLAPSMFASSDDAGLAVALLSFCIVGLTFVFVIPMLVLMIPALGRLAETGSIREAISLKKAFEMVKANPGGFIIAALLGTLINSLLGSIGMLFCFIGFYPATFVSYMLQGQLFGKAYSDAKANMVHTFGENLDPV